MTIPPEEQTADLLSAAQEGDSDAVERLLARYYPLVTRIVELRIQGRIHGDAEAEDIVQETMLDVFRGLHRFEEQSEGKYRHWLARIVENNIRDRQRFLLREKRGAGRVRRFADFSRSSLQQSIAGACPTPAAEFRAEELERRIEEAMLRLKPADREIIILRKLCRMEYEEMATLLGYKDDRSARAQYSRAIQALRRQLDRGGDPET